MQQFLFDRLCEPLQIKPVDQYDKLRLLRESITESLSRLFCHRNFFEGLESSSVALRSSETVLNFGLSDVVSYGQTPWDLEIIRDQMKLMIDRYEPRLHEPVIEIVNNRQRDDGLSMLITGIIKYKNLSDDFLWLSPVDVDTKG